MESENDEKELGQSSKISQVLWSPLIFAMATDIIAQEFSTRNISPVEAVVQNGSQSIAIPRFTC